MSLGDAILLGEAYILGAAVVTSDHKDFDPVEARKHQIYLV
jgi:hypothetical protein